VRCARCAALHFAPHFERDLSVCPDCSWHSRLTAPARLHQLLDPGSVRLLDAPVAAHDPLGFVDVRPYHDRLREARQRTGLAEAALSAAGTIHGTPLVVVAMDFRFMGGSLGTGVGEMVTQAAERCLAEHVPLLLVTASGGARMQEGVLSLMQMAKTSQALAQLDESGIVTISLITDPTYGGVAASFATLTDVIIAEPGARLGFAGPRVIEQTIRRPLPEGFQTAEFLSGRGLIDDVVHRRRLRSVLARLLVLRHRGARRRPASTTGDALIRDIRRLPQRDPWEAVRLARDPGRPTTLDYIQHLVDGFHELHGDRVSGDCAAMVGGPGAFDGVPVMAIGNQKGRTTSEQVARNFGMPTPSGYRKAARLMRLAAKHRMPIVTFVDTPGGDPGMVAEEHGQAFAVAENLHLMSGLPVPVIAVLTGEGGSGGALALSIADRVYVSANGIYSVISPEGCAAILWRNSAAAQEAAGALKLDARELLRRGIVDGVVPEPDGGAHRDPAGAAALLRTALAQAVGELLDRDPAELIRERRQRFRRYGVESIAAGVPA
jgi:acetyl-CoA carboxylase carboxyl transferase subunit beta